MAITEKKLNTRIILKHDTLANWNSDAAIILKEGEVALAKVDTNKKDPISGELVKVPTYLIKVGDGSSKFSALNWVAAPAADVHDWAKKDEAAFTAWVKTLVTVDDINLANYYTKGEADAKFVAQENGKSLMTDGEREKLNGISAGANKVEASTNGKIKIDGVDTTVYTHPDKHTIAEVDGLQAALDGKQAAGDYAAEEHTHTKSEITDFAHTHTASEITDFGEKVAQIKVNSAVGADQAIKDGNGDVIADTYAKKATTLAGYGIGDAYTKDEVDGEIEGAINTFVSAYITSDGGAIDKLQEIANWIDSDKDGAADIIADVEANTEGVSGLSERMDAVEDELETHGDIVTHNVSEFYTKEQADAEFTNATEVDGQIDAKIEALDLGDMSRATASDYVKKTDAPGYGDILTKTEAASAYQAKGEYYTKSEADAAFTDATEVDNQIDAKITALDLANTYQAKGEYYTKAEADAEFQSASEVYSQITGAIQNLKLSETYQAKGDYATAAQGALADTAIQNVNSVAGNGIKATKNGTTVTIDWDSNVEFVFDCGDSGVNA